MTKEQETIETWLGRFIVDRRTRNVSQGTIGFYRDKLGKFIRWCRDHDLETVTEIGPHELRSFLVYLEDGVFIVF